MQVQLVDLVKDFGQTVAVDHVNLTIKDGPNNPVRFGTAHFRQDLVRWGRCDRGAGGGARHWLGIPELCLVSAYDRAAEYHVSVSQRKSEKRGSAGAVYRDGQAGQGRRSAEA